MGDLVWRLVGLGQAVSDLATGLAIIGMSLGVLGCILSAYSIGYRHGQKSSDSRLVGTDDQFDYYEEHPE